MGDEEGMLIESFVEKKGLVKQKTEDLFKNINFFKRLKLIKGIVRKLRERTSFKKIKFVKNHQLKIIQDCSYDIESRKDNDPFTYFKPKVKLFFFQIQRTKNLLYVKTAPLTTKKS